jgi:hypothetical protein
MLLEQFRRRIGSSQRARRTVAWLREAARPPPGVELVTSDGALYSGIVVIDRNRPVAMFAARQTSGPRPRPPSPPTYGGPHHGPPGYGPPGYGSPGTSLQHRLFDEEEEAARRGESPEFWRR